MHTANKSRPAEVVDWLAMFPPEHAAKPKVEPPPVEDSFALFPLEQSLLEQRLIDAPAPPPPAPAPARVLPTRQVRPDSRPAIRIVVEPIDPGWKLPAIQLSAPAWTMILTGVAMMLLIVFVRTRLPSMPEVAHTFAAEPDVPSFALAASRGVGPAGGTWTLARTAKGWTLETGEPAHVDFAPPAATGKSLPIAHAKASPAARVLTPPVKPGATPQQRSADAIAPRSERATAAITPPPAATFGAAVNTGSLSPEPARVPDVAPATVVPAALTPPPPAPPAHVTESVTVRVTDTAAIESVLSRYRSAFTALDMREIQRVWPQVDRRALERTFSEVDEHALQFDDCRIDITGRDARAACSGIARSLPKGSTRPKLESRRWDFTLSKIGTDWLILSAQTRR